VDEGELAGVQKVERWHHDPKSASVTSAPAPVAVVRLFLRLFFGDRRSRRNMVPNSRVLIIVPHSYSCPFLYLAPPFSLEVLLVLAKPNTYPRFAGGVEM